MTTSSLHALRLHPDEDLKLALQSFVEKNDIRAGSIISGVGSLKVANLRFADQAAGAVVQGPLEIVALTGTVSKFGSHLHATVADAKGATVGGHLMSGAKVHTTVEVTILEASHLVFHREPDPATGYSELSIKKRTP